MCWNRVVELEQGSSSEDDQRVTADCVIERPDASVMRETAMTVQPVGESIPG